MERIKIKDLLEKLKDSLCFRCKNLIFEKNILEVSCIKRIEIFVSDCGSFKKRPSICENCKNMEDLKYSSLFEDYVCGANQIIGFYGSCDKFIQKTTRRKK